MNLLSILLQVVTSDIATTVADTLNTVKAAAATIPATTPKVEMDYLDLTMKGGIVMIPIFLLSFIGTYIFIERLIVIRKASKQDDTFMNKIKDYIMEGKVESATKLCQITDTPSSRMIEKGISRLGKPMNDVLVAIENVGNM